jgi:Domain of unknown function (DUF4382)
MFGWCLMNDPGLGFRRWASCAALLMLGFATACGSTGDEGGAAAGVVGVSLTDAPACGFDAVNVTVSKVRIHQSDSASDGAAGWTEITLNPPRKINLLDLNDPTQPNLALDHLGEAPLPAGHYTQLRLLLDQNNPNPPFANSVVLSGTTTEIALETPSAVQSGIKLVHQFDVPAGQRVDLLLDFDACKSILHTGSNKYKLKPVIKVIPFTLNGIEGFVDEALLGSNVVVTAQMGGEVVRATVPNANAAPDPNRGKFLLARLAPSPSYDVVITADNRATAVIATVPVQTTTSFTSLSTQAAPIGLVASPTPRTVSGTVTLNPAVDDELVLLAARQSLMSGPTVTVKSGTATVATGAPPGDYTYSLTLPTASPTLGVYTSSLPITLNQQPPAVGGQYAVRASADGYAAQSATVNIAAANATQNFTLTP